MLVLKRKEGQWIEIRCNCGCEKMLRFRVYDICSNPQGKANLAFDDPERNFKIDRPERCHKPVG